MKMRFTVLAFAAVLAGCGGGGNTVGLPLQTVSFGDSLSDAGTYKVNGTAELPGPLVFNGGSFTTNPGLTWAERIARFYGNDLKPAAQGGYGLPMVAMAGLGYAQGGAMVSETAKSLETLTEAKSITAQIDTFLQEHSKFTDNQLVLLQGGANDILQAVLELGDGAVTDSARTLVTKSATQLAEQVSRLTDAGARRMVVLNVPDLSLTPLAVRVPDAAPALKEMTALFNSTLSAAIENQRKPAKMVQIDASAWLTNLLANFKEQGFEVGSADMACSEALITAKVKPLLPEYYEAYINDSTPSLLCSQDTLTEPKADETFVFADFVHPANRTNALFAEYVEAAIAAAKF